MSNKMRKQAELGHVEDNLVKRCNDMTKSQVLTKRGSFRDITIILTYRFTYEQFSSSTCWSSVLVVNPA